MLGVIRNFLEQWPTPESSPVDFVCRTIFIPNDQRMLAAVDGALSLVLNEQYWRNEGETVEDTVELLDVMFDDYLASTGLCPMVLQEQAISAQHVLSSNTSGGATTANAWTICPFNLVRRVNTGDGSLASNILTIPAGTWHIRAKHQLFQSSGTSIQTCAVRLREHFGVVTHLHVGTPIRGSAGLAIVPEIEIVITAIMDTELSLEYRTNVAQATSGLGTPLNVGMDENYGEIICTRAILVTP